MVWILVILAYLFVGLIAGYVAHLLIKDDAITVLTIFSWPCTVIAYLVCLLVGGVLLVYELLDDKLFKRR